MTLAREPALQSIEGYSFPVLCSARAEGQARMYAGRVADAYLYLNETLGFTPELRLLTLAPEDWDAPAEVPMYGLPHTARGRDIVVGTVLGEFWSPIVQMLENVSTPGQWAELIEIHGTAGGTLDFALFNDLLPVHELGHLYHEQVPFRFPRLWLMEVFANFSVHVYIAAREPDQMPVWTSLPQQLASAPLDSVQHRSLEDFERLYAGVGADNYVWYQFRLIAGIIDVFEDGGVEVLRRLYNTFKDLDGELTDTELATILEERVHPGLAELMRTWPR